MWIFFHAICGNVIPPGVWLAAAEDVGILEAVVLVCAEVAVLLLVQWPFLLGILACSVELAQVAEAAMPSARWQIRWLKFRLVAGSLVFVFVGLFDVLCFWTFAVQTTPLLTWPVACFVTGKSRSPGLQCLSKQEMEILTTYSLLFNESAMFLLLLGKMHCLVPTMKLRKLSRKDSKFKPEEASMVEIQEEEAVEKGGERTVEERAAQANGEGGDEERRVYDAQAHSFLVRKPMVPKKKKVTRRTVEERAEQENGEGGDGERRVYPDAQGLVVGGWFVGVVRKPMVPKKKKVTRRVFIEHVEGV
jgi:hypothetical protein